jgi:hypothetical protein
MAIGTTLERTPLNQSKPMTLTRQASTVIRDQMRQNRLPTEGNESSWDLFFAEKIDKED